MQKKRFARRERRRKTRRFPFPIGVQSAPPCAIDTQTVKKNLSQDSWPKTVEEHLNGNYLSSVKRSEGLTEGKEEEEEEEGEEGQEGQEVEEKKIRENLVITFFGRKEKNR